MPPPAPPADRPTLVLALDTASPTVSVALGRIEPRTEPRRGERPDRAPAAAHLLAERSVEIRRSSEHLLRLVDEALEEAGAELTDLGGILALRGPGSFTGLRVGLATVLGLHQALGVPATAVPTLPVLALAGSGAGQTPGGGPAGPVAAVVDALRGEWFAQVFPGGGTAEPSGGAGEAAGEAEEAAGAPEVLAPGALAALAPSLVVGFGASRLAEDPEWPEKIRIVEPAVLAPAALEHAALRWQAAPPSSWDPAALTSPLYLRPPAVTPPKRIHPHGAAGR